MAVISARDKQKEAGEQAQRILLEQSELRAAHARAIGVVDFETLRVQALGAKKMREEAWLAEYRQHIHIVSLEWRPIVPLWLRDYLARGMHMRKLVAALLMRRVFK